MATSCKCASVVIILGASTLLIRPNLTNLVITCSTVIAKPGGLKGIASVKLSRASGILLFLL